MAGKTTVYEVVNDQICSLLEKGTVPWRKPWRESGLPKSLTTKKAYTGINVWLLNSLGFTSPYFVTWKKAHALGGQIKEGEEKKSFPVVFWKTWDKEVDGEIEKAWVLRYYRVYNVEQTTGLEKYIPADVVTEPVNTIEACEGLVVGYKDPPTIKHNGSAGYYDRGSDEVVLPSKEAFTSSEGYYSTLFHELVHSTGHHKRLNRNMDGPRGSNDYSFEELVAEMGASYLCATSGIDNKTLDNSASYIASWLRSLRDNPKWVVQAGGKAQKAVKWVLEGPKGAETVAEG